MKLEILLDKVFLLLSRDVIGIIGPSGDGKSTLTNLIVGFFPDFKGEFSIDDVSINQLNIDLWRKQLRYVSQSIYLTDDTIRANIASDKYGKSGYGQYTNKIAKY